MALGPAHEARECAASVQPVCSMCIKLYVDVHGSSLTRTLLSPAGKLSTDYKCLLQCYCCMNYASFVEAGRRHVLCCCHLRNLTRCDAACSCTWKSPAPFLTCWQMHNVGKSKYHTKCLRIYSYSYSYYYLSYY